MSDDNNPSAVPGDNPIRDSGADALDRVGAAKSFARRVLALDASEGAAVGIFGPWRSGKTSFINLARPEFVEAGIVVFDFNPWMFGGAEQLVERFFTELSAEMGEIDNLKEIGQAIRKYGEALGSVIGAGSMLAGTKPVGEILCAVLKTVGSVAEKSESTSRRRKKVEDALEKRRKSIVVVLDDVDRLSAQKIRDVFKLVRLTASFPNLIYIVACDRLAVEQALEEQGLPGRDYLEKILQWPFNLPNVPRHMLWEQISAAIDDALAGIENQGPFDEQVWLDIRAEIVRPLIQNMRDVRRYAITIQETVAGLDGQVALTDVLGLEAVRLFLPDVFMRLPEAIEGLTTTTTSQGNQRHIERQIQKKIANTTEPDMRCPSSEDLSYSPKIGQ